MTEKKIYTKEDINFISNYIDINFNPSKYKIETKEVVLKKGQNTDRYTVILKHHTDRKKQIRDERIVFAFKERDDFRFNPVLFKNTDQNEIGFMHSPSKNNKGLDLDLKKIMNLKKVHDEKNRSKNIQKEQEAQREAAEGIFYKKIKTEDLFKIIKNYTDNAVCVPWYKNNPISEPLRINGTYYLAFSNLISHIVCENDGKYFYPINDYNIDEEKRIKIDKIKNKEFEKVKTILADLDFKISELNPFSKEDIVYSKGSIPDGGKNLTEIKNSITSSKLIYDYFKIFLSEKRTELCIPEYDVSSFKNNPENIYKKGPNVYISLNSVYEYFEKKFSMYFISVALKMHGFLNVRVQGPGTKQRLRKYKMNIQSLTNLLQDLDAKLGLNWVCVSGFEDDYYINANLDLLPKKNLSEFRIACPEYSKEDNKIFVHLYNSEKKIYEKIDPDKKMPESFTKYYKQSLSFNEILEIT